MKDNIIQELINISKNNEWQKALELSINHFSSPVFSTSFGIEDQLITHYIAKLKLPIEIFTLDTGRLPNETYDVWQKTIKKYNIDIKPYYPDNKDLENFVTEFGINGFYDSGYVRHKCCGIRKIAPLKRALKNKDLWISGVTKAQSSFRNTKPAYEYDDSFDTTKYYPLLDVDEKEILEEIKNNNIPYNSLYDKGYLSIGCEPCTRAIKKGEDSRAGRWWWEDDSKKECGLHISQGKSK